MSKEAHTPKFTHIQSCIFTNDLLCGPENRIYCMACSRTIKEQIEKGQFTPKGTNRDLWTRFLQKKK